MAKPGAGTCAPCEGFCPIIAVSSEPDLEQYAWPLRYFGKKSLVLVEV